MATTADGTNGGAAAADAVRLATAPLRVPLAAGGRLLEPVRRNLRREVRRSLGVPAAPPRRAHDGRRHAAGHAGASPFLPADSVVRHVHGDLPAMSIGGLAALLLQMLHPLTMAGVADHSSYKEDPIGRLRRTASFIGATTFGSVDEAAGAIEEVREVHRRVHGRAPDGRRYSATDPELVTWVHVAGSYCFLRASQLYGPRHLSRSEEDRYYAATASVARALGARWVPETGDEVHAYLKRMRPELYAGPQALDARNFLLRGVARRPNDRAVHAVVAAGAIGVLPRWARDELRIPAVPLADTLLVRPVTQTFCAALRWTLRPEQPDA
jgi:uncharacterized protein (DUF2236 family)